MKVIMDVLAMGLIAALGAAPGMDGGQAADPLHDQVHGAPMAAPAPAPAEAKIMLARDAGTPAPKPPVAPAAVEPDAGGAKAAGPSNAMAADVKDLVDRMQSFYEQTQDFTARFQQDYTYKTFKKKQTSTGTVTFKKPGMMRWEYVTPASKTFVLANDRVYAYDPAAMLLTKGTFDSSQLSASVTFVMGKGKLADEFDITKVPSAEAKGAKGVVLKLTPRSPDPRFRGMRLEVDPKTAQVIKSTVIDPDGSENVITFLDFKANVGVSNDAFVLSPPPNTQIQDLTRGK